MQQRQHKGNQQLRQQQQKLISATTNDVRTMQLGDRSTTRLCARLSLIDGARSFLIERQNVYDAVDAQRRYSACRLRCKLCAGCFTA